MAQIDGQLTAIDRSARATLEQALSSRVRGRVTSRGGGAEYWLIGRTDLNEFLLAYRLPKQRSRKVAAGALSPELSSMLVAASRPDKRDRFLDPFAGSGALLAARIAHPARRLDYVDEQLAELRSSLPESLTRKRDGVRLFSGDARRLTMIDDHDVDVIVTDPPWGEHADVDGPYETFAAEVAAEFDRVLQPRHGRLVLLSSRRRADQWAAALGPLAADRQLEILINGHPATVLIGSR
jgi:tRNA G10  N-methylase Trm11